MSMNGRRRLTWVTAVTVASLLLGGGALNALAEGHGSGGDHGGVGQGKTEHQQQQKPTIVNQASHADEAHATAQNTEQASHEDDDANVQKHEDAANNVQKHQNDDNNVQRVDDDTEDLVTPPVRVTGEDRPGLGCGDDDPVRIREGVCSESEAEERRYA